MVLLRNGIPTTNSACYCCNPLLSGERTANLTRRKDGKDRKTHRNLQEEF